MINERGKTVCTIVKLKNRTWLYLRVEFPQELTWAVDPLLQYVKDYEP